MLNLTASAHRLRVVTGAAATIDVHASWGDLDAGSVSLGITNTAISTATTTEVVAGPSAGMRNVKTLFIRNRGAVPSVVTVQHFDGTTAFELYSAFLGAGGQIQYNESSGFFQSNSVFRGGIYGAAGVGSGAFILPTINATALSTIAGNNNRFEAVPFIPARDLTINQLALEVTTLVAASLFRLGLYADNGSAAPGSLLVGTAELSSASTGYKDEVITSRTLSAGELYWLVVLSSSTQTYRGVALAGAYAFGAPGSGTALFTTQRGTSTFAGGLPSTAPACTPTNAVVPAVRLRLA